ncbi:MAG: hypothetical protein ABIE84_00360 [bacterium]
MTNTAATTNSSGRMTAAEARKKLIIDKGAKRKDLLVFTLPRLEARARTAFSAIDLVALESLNPRVAIELKDLLPGKTVYDRKTKEHSKAIVLVADPQAAIILRTLTPKDLAEVASINDLMQAAPWNKKANGAAKPENDQKQMRVLLIEGQGAVFVTSTQNREALLRLVDVNIGRGPGDQSSIITNTTSLPKPTSGGGYV